MKEIKDGLYHRELGFPAGLLVGGFTGQIDLAYGRHAMLAAATDRYNNYGARIQWPRQIVVEFENIVELQVEDGAPVKAVVRVNYDDKRDLVFVIGSVTGQDRAFVRTVWVNLNSDKHRTLDASKYTRP